MENIIGTTLIDKAPVDRPYIKLIKSTKSYTWEIKVYSDTTGQIMDEIREIIKKQNEQMQKDYETQGLIIGKEE